MSSDHGYKLMEDLPPLIRERLEASGHEPPAVKDMQTSADGTRKYVFELHDGGLVEAAGLPYGDARHPEKLTVCYSSQVGCAMRCAFCATGKKGLSRNLDASEMLWQIILIGDDFGHRVDTVLAMGQGEPLANHSALIEVFALLSSKGGYELGPRDLMVSTCGVMSGIRALAQSDVAATLNVSLHAATQELRDELMPGVSSAPLGVLHKELARYNEATGRRVIIEYLMLEGVNDSATDLDALIGFCQGLDTMVVLLHFNRVEGIPYEPSSAWERAYWALALNREGIRARINRTRGTDVSAACGQLVNKVSQHG